MTILYIAPHHNNEDFVSYVVDAITGPYPVAGEYLGTKYCTPQIFQNDDESATIIIDTEFACHVGQGLTQAYINWGQSDKGPIHISPRYDLQTRLRALTRPQPSERAPRSYRP